MSSFEQSPTYDVFVSYCRNDEALAQRIARILSRLSSVLPSGPWRVFVDTSELHGGETWYRRIMTALGSCHTFVAVLSPHYLESRMCMEEWDTIATRQVNERTARTFPLLIAECELAPDMAKTQYVDLRGVESERGELVQKLVPFVADLDRVIAPSRGDGGAGTVQPATLEQVRAAAQQAESGLDDSARELLAQMEHYGTSGEAEALKESHRSLSRKLGKAHPRVKEWKPLLEPAGAPAQEKPRRRRRAGTVIGAGIATVLGAVIVTVIGVVIVIALDERGQSGSNAERGASHDAAAENADYEGNDASAEPPLTRFTSTLQEAAGQHAGAATWREILARLQQLPSRSPQERATEHMLQAAEQALEDDATIRLHPQAQPLEEATLNRFFADETAIQGALARGRESLVASQEQVSPLHDALRKALPHYNAALDTR